MHLFENNCTIHYRLIYTIIYFIFVKEFREKMCPIPQDASWMCLPTSLLLSFFFLKKYETSYSCTHIFYNIIQIKSFHQNRIRDLSCIGEQWCYWKPLICCWRYIMPLETTFCNHNIVHKRIFVFKSCLLEYQEKNPLKKMRRIKRSNFSLRTPTELPSLRKSKHTNWSQMSRQPGVHGESY